MSTITQVLEKSVTLLSLRQLQNQEEKFSCIALYDASMAAVAETQGVEVIIVGDSLGMTVQGHDSTLPVTVEQMAYHTAAVRRGNKKSLIIADMPFMTYTNPDTAMHNAKLIMQAGANMIKLEGGEWLCKTVKKLTQLGIPVCGHLGLTPQSVNKLGGYKVQGREQQQAEKIIQDAKALERAGADLLVLECIPSSLTSRLKEATQIITIGIGAGPDTDAQVLVVNDLLGITPQPPKFSKNFLVEAGSIQQAIANFVAAVKSGDFPQFEHSF